MQNSEMTEAQKENMVQGACLYCGQIYAFNDTIGGMTEEERNEEATKKCSCSEAKSHVRKMERRKKVEEFIGETFRKGSQDAIRSLIEQVENFEFDKATIKSADGWTTTIYMDKDSYLNIKQKKTDTGRELKA